MDKEELIARFESEMAKVKRPGIDKLMDYIRKSDFYTAPGTSKTKRQGNGKKHRSTLSTI